MAGRNSQVQEQDYDLTEREYNELLYNETLEEIDQAEDEGYIDSEDADAYRLNAMQELQERLMIAEGYDPEEVYADEDEEYGESMSLAEFSSAASNRFGAALLELGEAQGYDDISDYVVDLAEATGNSPEEIAGLITGEYMPDDELTAYLGNVFELPEDYAIDLQLAGIEARGEDVNDYLEDDTEEDEDYDEDEEEEESDSEDYSAVAYEVDNLRNTVAEFQIKDALKDELTDIKDEVERGLAQGWITPAKARQMLGEFRRDEDRVAKFSQLASSNGVDMETQLFAIRYALSLDEAGGQVVSFGQSVVNDIEEPTAEGNAIRQQARRNTASRLDSLGLNF